MMPDWIQSDFGRKLYMSIFGGPLDSESAEPAAVTAAPAPKDKKDIWSVQGTTQPACEAPSGKGLDTPRHFDERITPATLADCLKDSGVVGESSLGTLLSVALADGKHVLVEGRSGSGKSYILDKVLDLFPREDIYEISQSSGQAVWYDHAALDAASIIYIPELQKVVADKNRKVSGMIELVKTLTEGKDAKKIMTNRARDGVDEYVLSRGKTIVSSIALENTYKYDKELNRRFIILSTDCSEGHLERIMEDKVRRKLEIEIGEGREVALHGIREHVASVRRKSDTYVINPFVGYLKSLLPKESQPIADHYFGLFDSWGRFFSYGKVSFGLEGRDFLILDLSDAVAVHNMYMPHFSRHAQSITGKGHDEVIPDWKACLDKAAADIESVIIRNRGEHRLDRSLIESWYTRQKPDAYDRQEGA